MSDTSVIAKPLVAETIRRPALSSDATALPAQHRSTAAQRAFFDLLRRHLSEGAIIVRHRGSEQRFGVPTGPAMTMTIHQDIFFRRVLAAGNLGMGESFMAGEVTVEDGRLPELLTLLSKAGFNEKLRGDWRFLMRYGAALAVNRLASPSSNVRRHYDVGEELFDAFLLDTYQVYSCGYAHSQGDDAETLQRNKLERICQKVEIAAGQSMLDIGCGKGGLLIHAARHHGASGIGVTNSVAHHRRAEENAAKYGVADRVHFVLGDFRDVAGQFDRVVSVGMLEHVRPRDYAAYFRTIADRLAPQGRGLVHVIGCNTARNRHDAFIQRYIFPGSDTPKLSVLTHLLEQNRLAILDVENMARHYAVTLRRWLEAFCANAHGLDPAKYDGVFKRMWEYYLSCGIASANAGTQALYQVLFTRDYHAAYRLQRV